jgi:hypothetical protein
MPRRRPLLVTTDNKDMAKTIPRLKLVDKMGTSMGRRVHMRFGKGRVATACQHGVGAWGLGAGNVYLSRVIGIRHILSQAE